MYGINAAHLIEFGQSKFEASFNSLGLKNPLNRRAVDQSTILRSFLLKQCWD